jgi:hypothetical protein
MQAVPVRPSGRVHLISLMQRARVRRGHDGTIASPRATLQVMACAGSERPMLIPGTEAKPSVMANNSFLITISSVLLLSNTLSMPCQSTFTYR